MEEPEEIPVFDPSLQDTYTSEELEEFANQLLKEDARENRPLKADPPILFEDHLRRRRGREVFSTSGTVDETLTGEMSPDGQRMYWRTHPQGRKVNSDEQRKKNGASIYR